MKHLSITLLIITSIIFSCKKEETKTLVMGDFEFSQETISHNTPVTITYNGDAKEMEATYYLLNAYKSYPKDLNFENGKTTISIPDSIAAIALNFKVDGKYLNNDKKGYLFAVTDKNGTPAVGNKSSLEYYKITNGERYGLKGNDETFVTTLIEEANANAEVKEQWEDRYLTAIYQSDRKKGEVLANNMLTTLSTKSNFEEEDYNLLRNIYMMTKKTDKVDSISAIAIKKFPKGDINQRLLMNKFYDAKSLTEKETIFKELESTFGMNPTLSYALSNLASENFKKGNIKAFQTYVSKIESVNDKAGLFNSIAWPLAEKGEHLEMASQISKQSLDLIKSQQDNLENKPSYYTKKQYKKSLEGSYNMFADTYALIQHKLGHTKEAIKYQEQAIGDGTSAEINERYIQFLIEDKQYKLASEKANLFLNEGHSTEKITEFYKTAYTKVNPDANDFDTIITAIKVKSRNKELIKLKETMIDEGAPQFVLKNLDGENVSLTDLKGKTVILDFWATWCGPCKASFPAMQQVVEKYKDNESVMLLFVDTFEDGKNREKEVAKFIKDNNYDFQVLIDNKITDSNKYQVANKYGITGIPTKIIIGPNGRIKFKSIGFNGSNDKLKQEIDLMIELLNS